MPLKVVGVGAGYFAQYHYEAWQRMSAITLVGVCDQNSSRARSTAERYAIPSTYQDFRVMLQQTKPDIVDIITPPASHRELVDIALGSGAAIICQKPLAPNLAEAQKIVTAADHHNEVFLVHENFRFQPWFMEIKKLLEQQMLGRLYGASFRMRPGDGQGVDAYLNRQPYFQKINRFLIHETGIHFIDTYRYLFGEIRCGYAELRRLNPVIAGEDAGTVLFEFDNDIHAVLDANRLVDHIATDTRLTMGEMLIEGSTGVIRLDGTGRLFIRQQGGAESEHQYNWSPKGFAGDSVFACQSHLVTCIREGKPTALSARCYLRNLEIEEAIYESSRNARPIRL